MFKKRDDPEHPDGLMIKNFVMDQQIRKKTTWRNNYSGEADTTGYNPDAIKTESENLRHRIPIQERWKSLTHVRTELSHDSACHTFPPAVFLASAVRAPFVMFHRT